VERLYHKDEAGPTQVAVSPTGKFAAFAAFDRLGLERVYSDIYLWQNEISSIKRLTDGARVRDPAFASDTILLYVKERPDISQAIIRRDLTDDSEKEVFVSKPLERIAGLFAKGDQVLFALHQNNGQERIQSLSLASGKFGKAFPGMERKVVFERNPFVAADGSIYFAASYDHGSQDLYRFDPKTKNFRKVADNESGFLDRPILMSDGKTLLYSSYGLNGLDMVRATAKDSPPVAKIMKEDLHEFLTGNKPEEVNTGSDEAERVPYSAFSTPATSMWPQYWIPDIVAARDGALIGASTSGNDPLEYHRYGLAAQYDTRAKFPTYLAYYQNRTYLVNLFLQAHQINDYFVGTQTSNRSATYSAQAVVPIGEAAYTFGGGFQERSLFGIRGQNTIIFQNFNHTEFGSSAAAIAPNFGHIVNLYVSLYPNSLNEHFFADLRPSLSFFTRGLHPSHSISFLAKAGISTNSTLASNYYQGGGASTLSTSDFIVRGYPTDSLFGQRIATANLAYTMPIAHLYRGLGTGPLFFQSLGLRFMGDIGSANYMARYTSDLFRGYAPQKFMRTAIAGTGADLLLKGSLLYHVPVTLVSGLHYGFTKKYGGELIYMFGLDIGSLYSTGPNQPSISSASTGVR
jgi:hypothetical protein